MWQHLLVVALVACSATVKAQGESVRRQGRISQKNVHRHHRQTACYHHGGVVRMGGVVSDNGGSLLHVSRALISMYASP